MESIIVRNHTKTGLSSERGTLEDEKGTINERRRRRRVSEALNTWQQQQQHLAPDKRDPNRCPGQENDRSLLMATKTDDRSKLQAKLKHF